jgi:metallophosphoesterase superfamily enzyme
VGIRPTMAQAMAAGSSDRGGAITLADLHAGIEYALSRRGLVIRKASAG